MKTGIDYPGITIVFYCHDGNGLVVFGKRSSNCRDEHGRWDIGAGAVDLGKSVEDTLIDEIKSEYCSDVIDKEFLGYRDVLRNENGKSTHWVALDFKVLIDSLKVKNGEPEKFDEVRFFRKDCYPSPAHSHFNNFLERYIDRL